MRWKDQSKRGLNAEYIVGILNYAQNPKGSGLYLNPVKGNSRIVILP